MEGGQEPRQASTLRRNVSFAAWRMLSTHAVCGGDRGSLSSSLGCRGAEPVAVGAAATKRGGQGLLAHCDHAAILKEVGAPQCSTEPWLREGHFVGRAAFLRRRITAASLGRQHSMPRSKQICH